MGSSSVKYVDPRTTHADANEAERRLGSLNESFRSAEGKHRKRDPDSQQKRAQETLDENKVWGHKLVPTKETKFARVYRLPYHDDHEEELESYTQEILSEDTMKESVSLQDMLTIKLPDSPDPTEAHGGTKLRRAQHKMRLDNHEAASEGPRRTKKQLNMPFAEGMISGRKERKLMNIDEIREQQHKRIVEQIRLYDPCLALPDMPPPPPTTAVSAALEQRRRRLQSELDDADDLLDDLELQDEALGIMPIKVVGSSGSHRLFREEPPRFLTQSTKSSCEVVRVNVAEKAAVPKVPTKLVIPASLQRRMELSKKTNMWAASPSASASAAAAAASVTPKNEGGAIKSLGERRKQRRAVQRTITDLEIL